MPGVATTRMSSKGQVVIPEGIRRLLGLKAGSQFVVVAGHDAIVLKPIAELDLPQFNSLVTEARKHARRAGLRKADIVQAVRTARARE
ncbi:MAG: AbrB/MazE/SpoVT family DNA-binding domain-containing protein [Gammaproteobacteria bacterium]|nr:AbrB/MazE/SpoVT family DNA-binding domain-containing protein [Gammaproteobacteria bacterium]